MIIGAAELRRRYLLRIAGIRNKKVYIGPEQVCVSITNSCNLRCRYCVDGHAPGNPRHLEKGRFLSWENFEGIVRDCVDLQVDKISILGDGEPTIHPLFRRMLRHMERQPLKTALFTNATFSPDFCSDVIRADYVLINLGAADRQGYRDLHGKDLFVRVVNNIRRLVALRDSAKPKIVIDIAYVANAMNINQKQKMQDLARRLGINQVHINKMQPTQYNQKIALVNNPFGYKETKRPPVCLNGWFYTMVTSRGTLATCCRVLEMSHGDIGKESFKHIWLSAHMMKLRLLGMSGSIQKKFKTCLTCPFYADNIQRLQALAGRPL